MDTPLVNEKLLLADIDDLREQFPQTQDLYREVCILLFFRYGITPTANKLYQLVRKGSMSAPAEALNKFWEDLREKSRVRIEHPDLPEALKAAAGELTATLWSAAQKMAAEALDALRNEAQAAVVDAMASANTMRKERERIQQSLETALTELANTRSNVATLREELAAAAAMSAGLQTQLERANSENTGLQQSLVKARLDFSIELDKLRADTQLSDERYRALETRSLLEIDRERNASVKLLKELDTTRSAATLSVERMRSEITALQEQLGNLRENMGVQEGKLQAATAARESMTADHKTLQYQWNEASAQLTLARAEAEQWRGNAEELQRTITTLKEDAHKVSRVTRKTKTE